MRILLFALTLFVSGTSFADTAPPLPLLRARAAAAAKAFSSAETRYKTGQGDVETVYRWSVRWLDADLAPRAAALQEHIKRMLTLETIAKARVSAGGAPADDAIASEFFRAEAQIWATKS